MRFPQSINDPCCSWLCFILSTPWGMGPFLPLATVRTGVFLWIKAFPLWQTSLQPRGLQVLCPLNYVLLSCKDTWLPSIFTHITAAVFKKKKKKPRQNSPFPHSLEPWPPISLRTCMCVHSCHPTALTEFSSRSQLFPSAPFKPLLIRTNLAMSQNMTSPNFLFSLIKYFLHRQLTKEVDYLFLK